ADIGRPLADIALHIGGPTLHATIAGVLEKHEPAILETTDRNGRWYEIAVRPYWKQGKTVDGVVLTFTDIDDRKRSLEVAQRAQAALQTNARKLAASNAQLEEFASVASHDLREPLRMVASYLQLLGEQAGGKLDAEAAGYLRKALDGAARMQQLIHDLLAYAKLNQAVPAQAEVSLEEVLAGAVQNLRVVLKKNGAEVTHDPLPTVGGIPSQLTELFQNLIANGVKFHGGEPPRIHVSAVRAGAEWQVAVRDNGIGIAAKDQPRLFRLFQRLHTRTEYDGTGLGLAIAKKIVENHGGRIWVESAPGKGATFLFTLPRRGCRAMRAAARPFHVLLVDDEPEELVLIRKAFAAVAPSVRLTELSSCANVLPLLRGQGRHANQDLPDLVLMDLNMPKDDCHDVLASIKSDPVLGGTPIVVFSASDSEPDLLRSYQLHANSHIPKPPDYRQLKKVVASIHQYWTQTARLPARATK
ncbi:MAG TPA: ATP-binding protein, partial [Candidatus Thermoplasmatota archaeon]|nr:ATP-binding protein [Candidatus Thermoplasmatota archaeon]